MHYKTKRRYDYLRFIFFYKRNIFMLIKLSTRKRFRFCFLLKQVKKIVTLLTISIYNIQNGCIKIQ